MTWIVTVLALGFNGLIYGFETFFLLCRSAAAENKLEEAGFLNIAWITSDLLIVKPGFVFFALILEVKRILV